MNSQEEKEKIVFRYCEFPPEFPLIALLGEEWEVPYGRDAMHFHNYLEIGYCYYGEGVIILGKNEKSYEAGSVTVIPKNYPHHTVGKDENIQKWEYLYVDYEPFLKRVFSRPVIVSKLVQRLQSRTFVTSEREKSEIPQLVRMILDEMRYKREFYQENVQAYLLSLLLSIIRLNPTDPVTDVKLGEERYLEYIMDVLDFIEKNYQEDIRLEQMVQVSHMSETHFRRKFSEYMHVSPAEYVNLIRIEKACDLLSRSDENLTDIALQTGFRTNSAFIRNFKKIVGELPKDWRKKARENSDEPVIINNISILR